LIITDPPSPKLQATYEKTGFKWRKTATRGLLEYKKSKFFIGLLLTLVGWGIVALFPLLVTTPSAQADGFCGHARAKAQRYVHKAQSEPQNFYCTVEIP